MGFKTSERRLSVVVQKFGSSVLRENDDFSNVVHEIYRCVRKGERVVAVVSAVGDTTDGLASLANEFGDDGREDGNPSAYAELLATGEAASAALLSLSLSRAGIPSQVFNAYRAGLRTSGSTVNAEPEALKTELLLAALETYPVIIVPGFVGVNENDELALLGRGGSDLTAIFLATQLKAARCELLKDECGVFDSDPKIFKHARIYASLSWEDALNTPGEVIQGKAVSFALANQQPFWVRSWGGEGTLVGGEKTQFGGGSNGVQKRIRVALLGLGTVGFGVYQRLIANSNRFKVVGVAIRDIQKHLAAGIPQELLWTEPDSLLLEDIDVVIELFGGIEPAHSLVRQSLLRGRDVVTANKALIAEHGKELRSVATESGAQLHYSASVGGAVPMLEALARFQAHEVEALQGVLNGTTNFILNRLEEGASFDDAVLQAQEAGFAEADPTLDLNGTDAAQKLAIAAGGLLGEEISFETIPTIGIEDIQQDDVQRLQANGSTLRLVASLQRVEGAIDLRVSPVELPLGDPLAEVTSEENRLLVTLRNGNQIQVDGKGAGRWPTTEAVVGDLLDILSAQTNGSYEPLGGAS